MFSGAVVTIYNVLTAYGEEYSAEWYKGVLANRDSFPLFLVLAARCVVIGTAVKFVPLARGSGIPQIEGAIRGGIVLRWFRTLVTGFAASLAAVFLGLSAGSEGPSMLVGGCAGCGVGKAGRQGARRTRYLITAAPPRGWRSPSTLRSPAFCSPSRKRTRNSLPKYSFRRSSPSSAAC